MPKAIRGDYESRQDHIPSLKTPDIEVFRNVYQGRKYLVKIEALEFTAICPKTGLPDFGIITIEYIPDEVCLELKSLKEYFLFYRNVGIYHENLVNKVLEDLVEVARPIYMKVKAVYNIRGGMRTTVEREYHREG